MGKIFAFLSRSEEKDGAKKQISPFSDHPGPVGEPPPPWALLLGSQS